MLGFEDGWAAVDRGSLGDGAEDGAGMVSVACSGHVPGWRSGWRKVLLHCGREEEEGALRNTDSG